MAFSELLVGKTESEARKVVLAAGYRFRVVAKDGRDSVMSADLDSNRVNVAVEKGVVTEVRGMH